MYLEPRQLLKKYGFSAKKSWGQNFLNSERVYRAMVDATVHTYTDWVVEIGAGLGTLTQRLAERVTEGKVIAVERDRDMVTVLEGELSQYDNIEIHPANALTYDYGKIADWCGEPITVCGNLPYQIASQILFRLLEVRQRCRRIVVMLQKEMAERIVAKPATADYGAISVMLGMYFDTRTIVQAPRGAFVPPPNVDSSVILLTPLPAGRRAPVNSEEMFSKVVHAGFGQRRKTLKNALSAQFAPEAVNRALLASDIDGVRRGETLSVAEFARLCDHFTSEDIRA